MIITADALDGLRTIESETVDACITSPPYFGLRDYGVDGQIGAEPTPEEYIDNLVEIFREVRRTLKDDGTLWIVIGDTYAGSRSGQPGGDRKKRNKGARPQKPQLNDAKPKDLIGIPWLLAFALRADGWYLRQDVIWQKPNAMPESVKDRCTRAHEYIFMLTKSARYFYDGDAVKEVAVNGDPAPPRGSHGAMRENNGRRKQDGHGRRYAGFNERYHNKDHPPVTKRNRRSVWTVTTKPLKEAHFAVFPPDLIEPCVLASSRPGGIVIDPFCGSGTTGLVAESAGRKFIGIEINPEYVAIAERRLGK
jgi:DNA modification methylase